MPAIQRTRTHDAERILYCRPEGGTFSQAQRGTQQSEAAKWSGAPVKFDIVMVLPHLGPGGTQRVASTLANAWCDEGRRVCLITTHQKPEDVYRLRPAVRRITLPRHASSVAWGRLVSWITSWKPGLARNFVGHSFFAGGKVNFRSEFGVSRRAYPTDQAGFGWTNG